MKWLLTLGLIALAGIARADEPWAIELGIDVKSLIASPIIQKLKSSLGKEYDELMSQPMANLGIRIDQVVRLSGGCPAITSVDQIEQSLVVVFELGSAEETSAMVRQLGVKSSFPAGFLPAFPTAVGYKTPNGIGVMAIDGARVAYLPIFQEQTHVKLLSAAMKNHAGVARTMAAAKSHQYLRIDGTVMNMVKQLPLPPQIDSFKPLLDATEYTWHLSLMDKLAIQLKGQFVNEKDAEGAKDAVEQLLALAGVGLNFMKSQMDKEPESSKELKPFFEMAQTIRKQAKPKLEGTSIVVATDVALPENTVALLIESVQNARVAAGRAQSQNNMKQMAIAQFNYESTYQHFAANIVSKDNPPKELLSWRVAMLPYLEEERLHRQFKADEPWDSETNKKLLTKMPKVFVHPNADPKVTAAGKTYYRAFRCVATADDASECFLPKKLGDKLRMSRITDGTSNTIMLVEAAEPVEWTKPDVLDFDPKKPLPKLGGLSKGGFNVAMCDGSVRFVKDTIDPKMLKAMLTRMGGEVVAFDP